MYLFMSDVAVKQLSWCIHGVLIIPSIALSVFKFKFGSQMFNVYYYLSLLIFCGF